MRTMSHTTPTTWVEMAGAETIARVEAAIKSDPTFLAEAQEDLNGSVERRLGISFPVPLVLKIVGDVGHIGPPDYVATAQGDGGTTHRSANAHDSGELTDADLDLVSGGSSSRTCCNPECKPCDDSESA